MTVRASPDVYLSLSEAFVDGLVLYLEIPVYSPMLGLEDQLLRAI
jgi:hypothetical protein